MLHTYLILFLKRIRVVCLCSFYFLWNPLHRNTIHHLLATKDRLSLPWCCFLHVVMWILYLNELIQEFLKQRNGEHFFFGVDCSWKCVLTWPYSPIIKQCYILYNSYPIKNNNLFILKLKEMSSLINDVPHLAIWHHHLNDDDKTHTCFFSFILDFGIAGRWYILWFIALMNMHLQ